MKYRIWYETKSNQKVDFIEIKAISMLDALTFFLANIAKDSCEPIRITKTA